MGLAQAVAPRSSNWRFNERDDTGAHETRAQKHIDFVHFSRHLDNSIPSSVNVCLDFSIFELPGKRDHGTMTRKIMRLHARARK